MRFTPKIIRFQRHGCTNRPFFHIVVMEVSNLFRDLLFQSYLLCSAFNRNDVLGCEVVVHSFMCLLFLSVHDKHLKLCMCLGIAAIRMMFRI